MSVTSSFTSVDLVDRLTKVTPGSSECQVGFSLLLFRGKRKVDEDKEVEEEEEEGEDDEEWRKKKKNKGGRRRRKELERKKK